MLSVLGCTLYPDVISGGLCVDSRIKQTKFVTVMNIYNRSESADYRFFARLPDGRALLSCHARNVVVIVNGNGDEVGKLEDGQIKKPEGIAVNSKGHVFVVDRHNHCIRVFDEKLVQQRGIVTDFQPVGRMNQPVGIAISTIDDSIYVADNENHRVLVFTAAGEYRSTLGDNYGSAPGKFFCPCGVALYVHPVYGEMVIVSEWGGGRVQVFKADGSLFALYGGVEHAHHVVVDADGIIYVSEYSARKIRKFSLTGDILGGGEWTSSAVSLVAGKSGVDAVVTPIQVVLVLGECKKRRVSE